MSQKIAVLGAGSWGCTLGVHLYKKGHQVSLWDLPEAVELLRKKRHCLKLPDLLIPEEIKLTSRLSEVFKEAEVGVIVLPSQEVRRVLEKIKGEKLPALLISASKGIEKETLMTVSEVLADVLGEKETVILSGPSHAEEVFRGIPTTIVASSLNKKKMEAAQKLFMSQTLRIYTNSDVLGVELGGALKNVIAIAAGISDGLGFGDNTKAALITRGLAEITRLGIARGAEAQTFAGLSGMGDLIVTCTSSHSRNHNLGEAIGKGKKLDAALKDLGMVAEGVPTTKSAYDLSRKSKIEMPITEEIYQVLFAGKDPRQAVTDLMLREARPEH